MLEVGTKAPDFELPDQNGELHKLSEYLGKKVILYFYPKDNSSGCITEAKDFSKLLPEFTRLDAQVFGISPDSPVSHQKFIEKQELSITLLSDPEKIVINAFGVWVTKKMYGREYMGVLRSTFVMDAAGKILAVWDKVKVKGHASEVLHKIHEFV